MAGLRVLVGLEGRRDRGGRVGIDAGQRVGGKLLEDPPPRFVAVTDASRS